MKNEYEQETDDVYEALKNTDSTEELLSFINTLEKDYPDMSFQIISNNIWIISKETGRHFRGSARLTRIISIRLPAGKRKQTGIRLLRYALRSE